MFNIEIIFNLFFKDFNFKILDKYC